MKGVLPGFLPEKAAVAADDLSGEAFRRRMDEVVSHIPPQALRSVLDAVEDAVEEGISPYGKRTRHLRDALVHHFNRLRPMKARRLFTGLFEPFLVDDPILYRAPDTLPAVIQRADMGGIWTALSHSAFPALAVAVQDKLEAMARETMLDAVLASPQAAELREAMRREALDFLVRLAADRPAADRFLALANEEALQDARLRTQHLGRKAPIDGALLGFIRTVLEHPALPAPIAGGARPSQDTALPHRDQTQLLTRLGPLYELNVKRCYDRFPQHWRAAGDRATADRPVLESSVPESSVLDESHPLLRSLLGHFHAAAYTIRDVVEGLFGDVDLRGSDLLSLDRATRDLLAEAVDRLDRSLAVLTANGFLAAPSIGPAVRAQLAETGRSLTAGVLPVLAPRLRAAIQARPAPAPDHADVLWMVEWMGRWEHGLARAGGGVPGLAALRRDAIEKGRAAFHPTALAEDQGKPAHRMAHLLRIRRLMQAVGEAADDWIGPANPGLHRLVHAYLDQVPIIAEEEWAVIDAFVAAIRTERPCPCNGPDAGGAEILRLHGTRAR